MINLAIFASGSGTNTQCMIDHFYNHPHIRIALILSDNPGAFVLLRAKTANIPSAVFTRSELKAVSPVMDRLKNEQIGFIVLAGFLSLIPPEIIRNFPGRIINIHPALLPAYGGKGMYGMHVHRAVISNGDKESGISVHFVNEHYDEGKVIFQARCMVDPIDTPETLAEKIHELEYKHYSKIAEDVILRCYPPH